MVEDILIEYQKEILILLFLMLYMVNVFKDDKSSGLRILLARYYYEISFVTIFIIILTLFFSVKGYIDNIILETIIIAMLIYFVSNLLHMSTKYIYLISLVFISFGVVLFFLTKTPKFAQDFVSIGFAFTLIAIFKDLFYSKIFKHK